VIRFGFLSLYVAFFTAYAWKSWFRSLLALVLLTAVVEHPDMPKSILGIPGLNPWNVLFLSVVMAWTIDKIRRPRKMGLPRPIGLLLTIYVGVMVVSTIRMFLDAGNMEDGIAALVSEFAINTFKWIVPGLLLFDGARTRERLIQGAAATVGVYFLLAVQVIRWLPAGAALSGKELSYTALKLLTNEVGYHRVNLSMMLAGASWALFALRVLPQRRSWRFGVALLSLAVVYAQSLTAGRTGYGTWVAVGLVLCIVRWRRYLLFIPVVILGVVTLAPAVVERMMEGIGKEDAPLGEETQIDQNAVTSDRSLVWPLVIERIEEKPWIGHGRQAMKRIGLSDAVGEEMGEKLKHPHNAYLEMLLDGGWISLVLILAFYVTVLVQSLWLFRDKRSPVFGAIGGASSALLLALLFAAIGSQTFYPREGALGMWCMLGLMWRTWVERRHAVARASRPPEPEADDEPAESVALVPAPPMAARVWRRPGREVDAQLFARSA
jgi:O-antigen ligase